jgi:hypothetical protein
MFVTYRASARILVKNPRIAGQAKYLRVPHKARHDRLCWLTQKRAEKRDDKQRSKARETESISLVTRTPLALEIGHRDLPNRVTTSYTLARNDAGSRVRSLRMRQCTEKDRFSLIETVHDD